LVGDKADGVIDGWGEFAREVTGRGAAVQTEECVVFSLELLGEFFGRGMVGDTEGNGLAVVMDEEEGVAGMVDDIGGEVFFFADGADGATFVEEETATCESPAGDFPEGSVTGDAFIVEEWGVAEVELILVDFEVADEEMA
jgi:hypothetical protein